MTLRARAGTTITFYATAYKNGTPTNADSFGDVNVYDAASGGSIVTNGANLTPTAEGSGVYSAQWAIDSGQAAGVYYPEWDFTSGGVQTTPRSPTRSALTVLGAGTTQRELILADIKATIESITTANGYKTSVTKTEPFLRTRDDVKTGERPYIGFGADSETYEHQLFGAVRAQLPWTVVGYVTRDDWATASGDINDLRDDIIGAIQEDNTLGGNATMTTLVSDLTDEADPDRRSVAGDGAAVVLNFMTTYYRPTSTS